MRVDSLSRSLTKQWKGRTTGLTVYGRHDQVVNLVTNCGAVISLVIYPQDRGPFHLQGTPELLQDPPNWLSWPRIGNRSWSQDCRSLPQWSDKLPTYRTASNSLERNLRLYIAPILDRGPPAPVLAREHQDLGTRIRMVQRILTTHSDLSSGALEQAIADLLGLGSGLTPAGDDVLMGMLFLLQRLAPSSAFWNAVYAKVTAFLLATPAHLTTRISYQWISHAAAGDWNSIWHELSAAMDASDVARTRHILAKLAHLGHTSGFYTLTGMQTVLFAASQGLCP